MEKSSNRKGEIVEAVIQTVPGAWGDGTKEAIHSMQNIKSEIVYNQMTDEQKKGYKGILSKICQVANIDELKSGTCSWGKKAGAGFIAAGLTVTGIGAALAEDTKQNDAVNSTEVIAEGEMPSQQAIDVYGVKADAGKSDLSPAINPTSVSAEVTSSVDYRTLVSNEYDYKKETLDMIMDFNAPLPLERINNEIEAWKLKTFEDYKEVFRNFGVTDEYWLDVGAKGLYAYVNANTHSMGVMCGFADYSPMEVFFKAVVTGNTENFFCDKEGHPLFFLVNFTDKMKKGLKSGADKLEKGGIDNLYEAWRDSGACILYADHIYPEGGLTQSVINSWGVINFNFTMDIPKAKAINLTNTFACNMLVEPNGVVYLQRIDALSLTEVNEIAMEYMVLLDIVKDGIAAKVAANLKNDLAYFEKTYLADARLTINEKKSDLSFDDDLPKRLDEIILKTTEIAGEDLLETEDN